MSNREYASYLAGLGVAWVLALPLYWINSSVAAYGLAGVGLAFLVLGAAKLAQSTTSSD